MSRYRLERHIADDSITNASVDVLRLTWEYMSQQFEQLASDANLPEGAKPLWCLSWEYENAD